MKKVLHNPIFLGSLALLLLHQFLQKIIHYSIPVLDNYLDPLLCIPILLGFLLLERRWLFNKGQDFVFQAWEVALIVGISALIFELGFPWLSPNFTADWRDVLLYIAGGIVFYFWINK